MQVDRTALQIYLHVFLCSVRRFCGVVQSESNAKQLIQHFAALFAASLFDRRGLNWTFLAFFRLFIRFFLGFERLAGILKGIGVEAHETCLGASGVGQGDGVETGVINQTNVSSDEIRLGALRGKLTLWVSIPITSDCVVEEFPILGGDLVL